MSFLSMRAGLDCLLDKEQSELEAALAVCRQRAGRSAGRRGPVAGDVLMPRAPVCRASACTPPSPGRGAVPFYASYPGHEPAVPACRRVVSGVALERLRQDVLNLQSHIDLEARDLEGLRGDAGGLEAGRVSRWDASAAGTPQRGSREGARCDESGSRADTADSEWASEARASEGWPSAGMDEWRADDRALGEGLQGEVHIAGEEPRQGRRQAARYFAAASDGERT